MGYHATAIGGEEFVFGTEFIKDQIKGLKVPFLSANVYVDETHIRPDRTKDNVNPPSPPFSKGGNPLSPPLEKGDTGGFTVESKELLGRPYVIKEFGHIKVAILGLTAPPIKRFPVPRWRREPVQAGESGVEVADPLLKAREYLAILKDKVDIVIVVSDLPENRTFASEFGDIQVILSSRGRAPVENVNGTVVVTARSGYLARLDLYVSSEGRLLRHEINWIHLSEKIASDPEIKQFISRSFAEGIKNNPPESPHTPPLQKGGRGGFSGERLNQEGDNGYVGG
ncbi:MAG: hypothetical protein AB1487_02855 [Thermodesulfobacteriota bacterium]